MLTAMFDVDDTKRPNAGSRRRLLGGLLGGAAAIAGLAPRTTTEAHPSSSYCVESFEQEMLTLINSHRAANGRGQLKLGQNIGAAAQHHSADMADRNYFSHTTAGSGEGPSQRMIAHGYPANMTWWGENIYAGYGIQNGVDLGSAQAAFTAWKNSAGHNANMLNPNYTTIGIDRSSNPNSQYRNYWTTDFGGAADAPAIVCGGTTPPPSTTPVRLTIVGHRQSSNSTGGGLAYDGNPTSAWRSQSGAPSSAWVRFDLGSAHALSEIRWQFSQIGNADQFTVQVSSDAATWQTLATRTNAPAAGAWETLATTATGRYVRFTFANPNRDNRIGYLSEVQVYGPSTSGVTSQRERGDADFALVPAISSENAGGRGPSGRGRKDRRRKGKNKKRGNGKKRK
jgi:uncharacterized protein YkwD